MRAVSVQQWEQVEFDQPEGSAHWRIPHAVALRMMHLPESWSQLDAAWPGGGPGQKLPGPRKGPSRLGSTRSCRPVILAAGISSLRVSSSISAPTSAGDVRGGKALLGQKGRSMFFECVAAAEMRRCKEVCLDAQVFAARKCAWMHRFLLQREEKLVIERMRLRRSR